MHFSENFNYSDWLAYESSTPISWAFGNTKWHALETDATGRLEFNVSSCRPGAVVERLCAIRLSEALPLLNEKIIYKPHSYTLHREYCGNDRTATLVFPPERQGAVLNVKNSSADAVQSQMLIYSRLPGGENVIYPDYNSETKEFSIVKDGFWLKISFIFEDLAEWTHENAWHAARAGYRSHGDYSMFLAFGRSEEEANQEMEILRSSSGSWEDNTLNWWNDYFSSCPLVSLKEEYKWRNDLFNQDVKVDNEEFLKRQLWHYHAALGSFIDVPWCAATPAQPAERFVFNKVFTNDNSFGILALSMTNQAKYARAHLINFIKYVIHDDGQMVWCASVTGERASYPPCNGVPAIAHTLGHYIRCTGDASILDEDAGGMTVWEKIKLYDDDLLKRRDSNQDGLIEWNHIWENGEDNKISPFFRKKGLLEWVDFYEKNPEGDVTQTDFYRENACPATIINEQVFYLWSLREMTYIAELRGEDTTVYQVKADKIIQTISDRHWDSESSFYYDYDVRAESLYYAKNMDAFYFLYFEPNRERVEKLLEHLKNPDEFNLVMIPSLSRDDIHFDPESYWAGAAWPREQGFVAMGLKKHGYTELAFELMLKSFCAETGPIISETVNPLTWPLESHGTIRTMVMASCNLPMMLDICGLNNWEGKIENFETDLPVEIIRKS